MYGWPSWNAAFWHHFVWYRNYDLCMCIAAYSLIEGLWILQNQDGSDLGNGFRKHLD
uniref:Uncharacterized protein n=1 Tax=Arundo donax TaxID=35708 RepID=A0A0A9HJD1_ARUDO